MQNLSKTGCYFGDPGGTYPPKLYLRTPPRAVFEAGSMANLAPSSNLVFLFYTVRVKD